MIADLSLPRSGERTDTTVQWILRVGLAACFTGHGVLGLHHPAAWAPYLAVVGISRDTAFTLMPLVGAFDIALAVLVLIRPIRAIVFYMAIWALWTALLRPVAGEPVWEAVERAGNYGVPFALLLMFSVEGGKAWWTSRFAGLKENRREALGWVLRLTTVLLLLGHGALGLLVRKPLLSMQYSFIDLPGVTIEPWIGALECLLALAIFFKPTRSLLLGVVVWKLATEALNPIAGSPVWVFVEHGGSYAAPLALSFLLPTHRQSLVPAPLPAT